MLMLKSLGDTSKITSICVIGLQGNFGVMYGRKISRNKNKQEISHTHPYLSFLNNGNCCHFPCTQECGRTEIQNFSSALPYRHQTHLLHYTVTHYHHLIIHYVITKVTSPSLTMHSRSTRRVNVKLKQVAGTSVM